MTSTIEYKCPCCGGAIEFDSQTQKMKCPYCDSEFDVETLKEYDTILNKEQEESDGDDWNHDEQQEWNEGIEEGIRIYVCKSCGGEILAEETTGATTCPYCGNNVVMSEQFSGVLKPDKIVPFKFDKKAAKEALMNHYKGKKLLPKVFKKENHIDEIKGVYVPFWLFDCDVDANIRYKGEKVRMWSDSRYNYEEISTYMINRSGSVGFERVPVDGSSKMMDEMMESIEPFNIDEAVDFQSAYLAGYVADKYDVDAQASVPRANERIKNSTEEVFKDTVQGYNMVFTENSCVNLHNGDVKYMLLPVWMLNTTWNGNKYSFAMNGQTGKLIGDLPVDKGLFWKWFGILTGILGVAFFGIFWLIFM